MKESRKKKDEQLGMPLGTASAKLRKSILFSLLRESHKNVCYQCGITKSTLANIARGETFQYDRLMDNAGWCKG